MVRPAERQHRSELRALAVRFADSNALTDPWWDVALAIDNEERADDLLRLVDSARRERPLAFRDEEELSDALEKLRALGGES